MLGSRRDAVSNGAGTDRIGARVVATDGEEAAISRQSQIPRRAKRT